MLRFKKRTKVLNERSIPLSVLIFLEISAIIIGVLLGFTVNEWRENRNNRKVAEDVLQTIAAEMSYNHNQIVNSEDYGYTLRVEPGVLLDEMNYQMQGYPGLSK